MGSLSTVPWLALLALDKDEKAAVEKLKTLAGSFGAGAISGKLDIQSVVAAARGEAPAPNWLLKASRFVRSFSDDPTKRDLMLSTLRSTLTSNDVDVSALISVLRKVAPVVGVDPEGKEDDAVVVEVLETISANVYSGEDNPQYTGIVQCPQCHYTHLV